MSVTSNAASDSRPLHFGLSYEPYGAHPGGWRKQAGAHDPFSPDQLTRIAQRAEAAKFTFIQFSDHLQPEASSARDDPRGLAATEALTTASFLATRTRRIGILATGNASYFEPFNLARLTASLDHVTRGRAGWVVTTGASEPAARNYSQSESDAAYHYARADEVVGILRDLWDSWEDEAFVRDKATGEYVDGSKVHAINHQGKLFRVKGPLNVARPPQGQLVVAHEISSDLSYGLAASRADLVFLGSASSAEARLRADRVRQEVRAAGRDAAEVRIFAEARLVIGRTTAEAQALFDELQDFAADDAGAYLIGDGTDLADRISALAETSGADGVRVRLAFPAGQLDLFADHVSPELVNRGLLAADYRGTTLRDHLGLARPLDRYAAA